MQSKSCEQGVLKHKITSGICMCANWPSRYHCVLLIHGFMVAKQCGSSCSGCRFP